VSFVDVNEITGSAACEGRLPSASAHTGLQHTLSLPLEWALSFMMTQIKCRNAPMSVFASSYHREQKAISVSKVEISNNGF